MASSDDEGESLADTVSNYSFVDDKDEPISFSELPVQWNDGENPEGKGKQIFLHGSADNGLQKIFKQVTAWKFDLADAKPEILVLSKENIWIKLQKPRKSYEDTIRSILITVHCLHFVKKNPETPGKYLWDHLAKVFSLYEVRPSENDIVDHITLISEAVKRVETLRQSKLLVTFLEEKPRKRNALEQDVRTEVKSGFIVDDDMIDEAQEDESDEEGDLFDSVCSICDNGGELLCCEGRCMRSFHATVEAGSESECKSLGLSDEQVEAIQNFFCKNCLYKQHQCFSCGELGSSDKQSGAEVFPCVSATCGRFYHPHCVAKLLHRESETDAEKLQKKIAAGESFTCPVHKCHVCRQGEDKLDPELQFAICRRCPKSYHRKCLPRKIAFEELEDEGIIQRAWEGLLPNRILIYCLKHVIDDDLGTPIRNHIKFPKIGEEKKKRASDLSSSREKVAQRNIGLASEDLSGKRTDGKALKGLEKLSSVITEGNSSKSIAKRYGGLVPSRKQKVFDTSNKRLKKVKVSNTTTNESRPSLGESLFTWFYRDSEPVKSRKEGTLDGEHKKTPTVMPAMKEMTSLLTLDVDAKKRIKALIKDASSSITLENIIEKHKVPTTHAYSSKNVVDKTITLGKVEGSVEAVRDALEKLDKGCSIEDAKAVCEPGLLHQISKWKNKLKVYLAPFLHGMRYTSFGRHFTKVDKLKEIVDMLHWYVQEGDTIVDFCCGANDFSCLMKRKLDETGKKCLYKNYDVLQAKNDFYFEKRDWMSVRTKELPPGSQLIMGLNPPFGVNAALANKFINKALEFKPKLLILIVPPETERLDRKEPPYDLVWEDDELLSGKSFYLPGSVDVNDKQMDQWNLIPPPLYLWSRADWTAKHKEIAEQHAHSSRVRDEITLNNFPAEDHDLNHETLMLADDNSVLNEEPESLHESATSMTGSHKEVFPSDNGDREGHENHGHGKNQSEDNSKKRKDGGDNGDREGHENHGHGKNQSEETSKKRQRGEGKRGRGSDDISPEDTQNAQCHSPAQMTGSKSLDRHPSERLETPSTDFGNERYRHFDYSNAGLHSQFPTGYGGTRAEDITMRYGLSPEEPYSSIPQRWSRGPSPLPDFARVSTDGRGYGTYINEMDDRYGRGEANVHPQVRLYGQQDPNSLGQRNNYLAGQDPGLPSHYGRVGLVSDSSYNRMNTSAMQRYAPRLDELNHVRMNAAGSQPSLSRSSIYDPLASQPGNRVDSLGYAPGPYNFSRRNSSGWLND